MAFHYFTPFIYYMIITSEIMYSSLASFVPVRSFASKRRLQEFEKKTAEDIASLIPEADLTRAVECADNFGKCSPKEIEHLKNELHVDRMKLFFDESSGLTSPLDIKDEVGRRLLEEDLTLQLALLNNGISLPMDRTIAVRKKEKNEDRTTRNAVQSFIIQGVLSFTFYSFMVCATILILMLAPQLLHS